MSIEKIEYVIDGDVIEIEGMIYKRLYAVGQSVVINSSHYRVTRVGVVGDTQKVTLESTEKTSTKE